MFIKKVIFKLLTVAFMTTVLAIVVTSAYAIPMNGTETTYDVSDSGLTFDWDKDSQYDLSFSSPGVNYDELGDARIYEFTIPNFYDPLPKKTVEITMSGANGGATGLELARILDVFGSDSPYGVVGPSVPVQGYFVSGVSSPTLVAELWEMSPNPDWEQVKIWAPTAFELQRIQIVTQSFGDAQPVPEPTTMLLLGSGLIVLAGFGRKKFKR